MKQPISSKIFLLEEKLPFLQKIFEGGIFLADKVLEVIVLFQKLSFFFQKPFSVLNSFRGFFVFILLCLTLIIYAFVFFKPLFFTKVQAYLHTPKKTKSLLNQMEEPVEGFGLALRVDKVKKDNKIFLEFFLKLENQAFSLINSVPLEGNREAYFDRWEKGLESAFSFPEQADSLFITWNEAEQAEIIAPTFNSFFIPVLNRVLYNKNKKIFELSPFLENYSTVKSRQ